MATKYFQGDLLGLCSAQMLCHRDSGAQDEAQSALLWPWSYFDAPLCVQANAA